MNTTIYLRNKLIDHALGTTQFVMPTTLFAGVYVVAPTENGGGTEASGVDYIRVSSTFSSASSASTTNNADIRFPASGVTTSSWGTLVSLGLFDGIVNGNLLFFGNLSANVVMGTGNDFLLAAGTLTISFT